MICQYIIYTHTHMLSYIRLVLCDDLVGVPVFECYNHAVILDPRLRHARLPVTLRLLSGRLFKRIAIMNSPKTAS